MKVIFRASLFDNPNMYYQVVEAEESVITMRHRIYKINQNILKKGGKYSCVDPSLRYVHLEKDGQED